eukprot:12952534-Alexandrium_andersonii.AAC.1
MCCRWRARITAGTRRFAAVPRAASPFPVGTLHSVCREDVRARGGLVPPRPSREERIRLWRSWG